MIGEFFIIKKRILRLIKGQFKNSDIVLDVGCGEKPYYHESVKSRMICADIKKTKKSHIVCDASCLPLKKARFDGIICVNSLYYYGNPFEAVKGFSHVLKKNGKLILITPFIYPIHDIPDDKYRFAEYGLREILKNDFEIKEIKTIGGIFNIPAVFFHSVIKGAPLMLPKPIRPIIRLFALIIFYIPYMLAQLLSLLDFLDRTRRWPTYYLTVALRK